VQIGWAADGYPIYGNLGPSDPKDLTSALRTLRSSYRLKTGNRPAGDSPQGVYDGSFSQDFEYVAGSGDLDANNGRSGPTPEFPNGTYYYVLTETFPFVPRTLRGTPDASFRKGGPGAGGPRVRQETTPTPTATNGRHWFVVRDGILYQVDIVTGKLVGKTTLPSPENR
ncbi:MAG: YHYH protein, partial [Armatimonadaceae bacterium]